MGVNDCLNWKDGSDSSSQLTGSEYEKQPKQHPGKTVGASHTASMEQVFSVVSSISVDDY